MLSLVLFTAIVLKISFSALAIALIWFLWKLRNSEKNQECDVPGPSKPEPCELAKAGSLPQYLEQLHERHGPIVKLYLGDKLCVSLGSAELLETQMKLFDRPYDIFALFEPLITSRSIQMANKEDGLQRRTNYDRHFNYSALLECEDTISEIGETLCNQWNASVERSDQRKPSICVQTECLLLALQSVTRCFYGEHFKDSTSLQRFKEAYDVAWDELENSLVTGIHFDERNPRFQEFTKAKLYLYEEIERVMNERQSVDKKGNLFIDHLMDYCGDDKMVAMADALTFMIGGFHTTGFALTYIIYYLAKYEVVQEKLRSEILNHKGTGDQEKLLSWDTLMKLPYLRACIDESLRVSKMAPLAARISEEPLSLAGYEIPPIVPILHALHITFRDPHVFPEPHVFRPERFLETKLPRCGFQPFGVGRRKCPGYRFFYLETSIWLVQILTQFRLSCSNYEESLEQSYGFVTKPKEDIFIEIEKL